MTRDLQQVWWELVFWMPRCSHVLAFGVTRHATNADLSSEFFEPGDPGSDRRLHAGS